MCDRDAKGIAHAIQEVLGSASAGLTTDALLNTLSTQGVCGLHVRLALRTQLKNGALAVSRAASQGEPQTDASAVWVVAAAKNTRRVVHLPGNFVKYVDQILGRGGMSVVYAGRQNELNRPVAIKTLHGTNVKSEAEGQLLAERMKREAKALALLNHPNIVSVFHAAVDKAGHPFIVMEKIDGETLDEVIRRKGRFDLLRSVWVGLEIVRALRYAYSKAGVLHRDIKPSNIMLTSESVKVMDFGLAKLTTPDESAFSDTTRLPVDQDALTSPGAFLGTFLTQAPEAYTGPSDVRSDIYAFGGTLYYLLSGGTWCFNHPVTNDAIGLWVNAHLNVDKEIVDIRDPSRRPDASPALARIVHTCLKREPRERFQSWDQLFAELDRVRRHLEPKTTRSRIPVPPQDSSATDAGLTSFLSRLDEAHRGASSTTEKVLPQTSATALTLPPTPAYLSTLIARARAAEETLRTQYGPDALSEPGPFAAAVVQLTGVPSDGKAPISEIFRQLLEAETGISLDIFDELYAAIAGGDEAATKKAPCHIAIDPTWYFYLAESMARQEDDTGERSFPAQAAAEIVLFLEYLCNAPELAPHRIDTPQPSSPPQVDAAAPASAVENEPVTVPSQSSITMAADNSSPAAPPPESNGEEADVALPAGTKIGDAHVIVRRLGGGGNGEVYLARHEKLNREQAIKMLRPNLARDREFVQRFDNEARMAAQLGHPHIVPVYDFFEWGGTWCLVMAYVSGSTLTRYRETKGTLEPREALLLVRQILDALDHAHRAGLVHRDIKPDNILLDQDGKAYLTDFGLVKSSRHEVGPRTTVGVFWGTPEYASPEQAKGISSLDPRTDLYSLGAVLYELLTGQVPFTAATKMAVLYKISDDNDHPSPPRELVPDLDYRIDVLVSRMLAKQPEERYLRARDVIEDIDRILESMERGEAPKKRRSPAAPAFAIFGTLALAALLTWLLWPTGKEGDAGELAIVPRQLPALPPEKPAGPKTPKEAAPETKKPEPPEAEPKRTNPTPSVATPPRAPEPASEKPHVAAVPPPAPKAAVPIVPAVPKLTPLERLAKHEPTDMELNTVNAAFQVLRESLPARMNYSFQKPMARLRVLKQSDDVTPWSAAILDAELERLEAGKKAFSTRPLLDPKKEVVLLLRDGRTLRGTVHSETADEVTLVLPNELREPVSLSLILPTSFSHASPNREGGFAPRSAAGNAAGVLPSLKDLPPDLEARHLPGLVSSAIDESLRAAQTRGDFRLLTTVEVSQTYRDAIGLLLEDRLNAFDSEKAAAKLYLNKKEPQALGKLLSDFRKTIAGGRAAKEILEDFLRSLPDTTDPELRKKYELIHVGITWTDDKDEVAPWNAKLKVYRLKSPLPNHESRIFRKAGGSRAGFTLTYRLGRLSDPRTTLFQLGTSPTRYLRIQGTSVSLVEMAEKTIPIHQKLALLAPLKRATIAVVPRPEMSLNLWYLNGHLLWALPDGPKDYPIDGIIVSVYGGEVLLESVRLKKSNP